MFLERLHPSLGRVRGVRDDACVRAERRARTRELAPRVEKALVPGEGERPGDDVFVVIVDAHDVERVVDDVDVAGDVCLSSRTASMLARRVEEGVPSAAAGTTRTPFSTWRRFGDVERL